MLLSVEFRSHSAIALYIKPDYKFQVVNVPLPFAFCNAPYTEKLAEVLKTVAAAVGDEAVLSYPAENKIVIVDESVFGKLRATLGLSTIYINDTFSEVLPLKEVARFTPFPINLIELSNTRANQSLIGTFFPVTKKDLDLQAAICKTIIRQLSYFSRSLPPEILLSGPILNQNISALLATEIFLDGVDGSGLTYLYHDRQSIAALKMAASLKIDPADFAALGSVVIWPGPTALEISFDDKRPSQKLTLNKNTISRFPLGADQKIKVKGQGHHGDFKAELLGGEVGVVFDCRERPLARALDHESFYSSQN